ncbi:MAG: UDP-N-acetylmuramyl-tripeptide synthetase [Eubacteriaceae bacterium]|nr:UDP-N-acetylmuramyl-tripeptide synthetase [Eubacteriaceae bacterium]
MENKAPEKTALIDTKTLLAKLDENGLLLSAPLCDQDFGYISFNSNDIRDNTLFICKGRHFRQEYLQQALANGATCYVSEESISDAAPGFIVSDVRKATAVIAKAAYGTGISGLNLIAVTGSKGKTTTTRLIFEALSRSSLGKAACTSSVGYYDGRSEGAHPNHNTTMESLDTLKVIRNAIDNGVKHMVVEASSQAAKDARLHGIDFAYGIFTNIDSDHISPFEHADFEEYLSAKIQLMQQCGSVIAFKDLLDAYPVIAMELKGKNIYTFGLEMPCDFYVDSLEQTDCGYRFSLWDNTKDRPVRHTYSFSIFGEYNVKNAAAAAALCLLLGVSDEAINDGFQNTQVEGRSEIVEGYKCPIIIDYAHNRLSASELFKAVTKAFPERTVKTVFGCPGNKGINRRKELTEVVAQYSIHCYITNEDPADEEFADIASQMVRHIPEGVGYSLIEDREEAIIAALESAEPSDIIAIIGKGDEKTITYKGVSSPYKGDMQSVLDYIGRYAKVAK